MPYIESWDDLIPAGYSDSFMWDYDYGDGMVFLGDAAHATSPQLGQGANLALADAWALSKALERHCGGLAGTEGRGGGGEGGEEEEAIGRLAGGGGGGDGGKSGGVKAALKEYTRLRRWRLIFYQTNSRFLTPVFQSNSRVAGLLRDIFMGPLCHFPPTKLQMLTVMSGAQNNGWPYSTIPEEEYLGFVDGYGEEGMGGGERGEEGEGKR